MDNHSRILLKLCRICTGRVLTFKEITSKKSKISARAHMDAIFILYGIDVSCDNASVHPQSICTECYRRIINSRRTGTQGPNERDYILDGVYGEVKKWSEDKNIWCEHSDEYCKVCLLYQKQSSPFSRMKADRGRPAGGKKNILFDVNGDNIFAHLFTSASLEQSCSITFINSDDYDSFLCSVCRDILHEQTVSTSCHYFCALCLSQYFTNGKANALPCPVCYRLVHVHSIHPISEHLLSILNKVYVQCVRCDSSGRLSGMRQHQCPSISGKHVSKEDSDIGSTTIQTTPKSCHKIPSSLKHSASSAINETEDRENTHSTLHDNTDLLTSRTGGDRLHKIVKRIVALKSSESTSMTSPLKQRRVDN